MKHHTIKLSLEEITSLPDLSRAAETLFERLNLDLRSDAMHNRKMVEVSCHFDEESGFMIRYYSAPSSLPDKKARCEFDPEEYVGDFEFRGTLTAGPDPRSRVDRERIAEMLGCPTPYTEEELARPVPARPRRMRDNSFIDPYGQCAEVNPIPESVTNDCGQVTCSPS